MRKWDLKSIFPNQKAWDSKLAQFRNLVETFHSKINETQTIASVKSVLALEKRLDKMNDDLYIYITLKAILHPENESLRFKELEHGTICNTYQRYSTEFEANILSLPKSRRKQLLKSKSLKSFLPRIEKIIFPKRNSTKKEERLLSFIEPIKDEIPYIYSTVLNKNVSYKAIHVGNEVMKVSPRNLKKLESSRSKNVRRNTYVSKIKGELKTQNTQAQTLNHHFQLIKVFSETRKYPCSFDYVFKEDELKEKMAKKIIAVALENKDIVAEFIKVRKKELGIRNYCSYDDKVDTYEYKMPLKDGYKNILEAFKHFGASSVRVVEKLKENRHLYITDKASEAKSFSGFCLRVGDRLPYVFSYYQNDLDSAMTLAHELGHAIHETKLNKHNDFWNKDTSLTIHETASYTHELVFLLDLLERTGDKRVLMKLINYYYDVLYKKALNTKYELALTKQAEKNKSFDPKTLSKKYETIDKDFFDGIRTKTKFSDKEWVGNERLFWEFYELKYIIAFALASKIARGIFDGDNFYKKKFKEMMRLGDETLLKTHLNNFGFKLKDIPSLVQEAFDTMNEMLGEFKSLE